MPKTDCLDIISMPKISSSNTTYLTIENLNKLCNAVIPLQDKQCDDSELSQHIFSEWNRGKKRPLNRKDFFHKYRPVIHSWSLYYFENGKFFPTSFLLDYENKKISYNDLITRICQKWQYPRPQQRKQPKGPFRPMVSLLSLMLTLENLGMSSNLSIAECNLFFMSMSSDKDLDKFVRIISLYRNDRSLVEQYLSIRGIKIKQNGYDSGADRITWFLQKSGAINRTSSFISISNKIAVKLIIGQEGEQYEYWSPHNSDEFSNEGIDFNKGSQSSEWSKFVFGSSYPRIENQQNSVEIIFDDN